MKPFPKDKDYIPLSQLGEYVPWAKCVCIETLRGYCRSGRIEGFKIGPKNWFVSKEEALYLYKYRTH